MKRLALFCLLLSAAAAKEPQHDEFSPNANINARYTIESVELESPVFKRISRSLRSDIDSLVGQKFDPKLVSDLAARIRTEVHKRVTHKIERGDKPEHVRVIYTAEGRLIHEDDTAVTKLKYHHKQGWTGGLEAKLNFNETRVVFGIQSDADLLLERFAGINTGFTQPVGDHVRLHFDFDAFHQQWNRATLEALEQRPDVPGIYRERYNAEPGITFILAEPVTVTAAISIQHFQTQFPAARSEAANAFETTLRYRKRWRESDSIGQELDAGYTLRAATNLLDSDFVYSRHTVNASYKIRRDRNLWTVRFLAGRLNGRAPLFDRFSLGNATTLRGWHKFDIDPLGGDRAVHGSVGYRYRALGVFYDAGSVWEHGKEMEDRHSVGMTLALGALRDGPYLTLAFPLRNGAIQPLFMMGMNF